MEATSPRPTLPRSAAPAAAPGADMALDETRDTSGLDLRAPDPDDDCVTWTPVVRTAPRTPWYAR